MTRPRTSLGVTVLQVLGQPCRWKAQGGEGGALRGVPLPGNQPQPLLTFVLQQGHRVPKAGAAQAKAASVPAQTMPETGAQALAPDRRTPACKCEGEEDWGFWGDDLEEATGGQPHGANAVLPTPSTRPTQTPRGGMVPPPRTAGDQGWEPRGPRSPLSTCALPGLSPCLKLGDPGASAPPHPAPLAGRNPASSRNVPLSLPAHVPSLCPDPSRDGAAGGGFGGEGGGGEWGALSGGKGQDAVGRSQAAAPIPLPSPIPVPPTLPPPTPVPSLPSVRQGPQGNANTTLEEIPQEAASGQGEGPPQMQCRGGCNRALAPGP